MRPYGIEMIRGTIRRKVWKRFNKRMRVDADLIDTRTHRRIARRSGREEIKEALQ
jgi:hypothetical protein